MKSFKQKSVLTDGKYLIIQSSTCTHARPSPIYYGNDFCIHHQFTMETTSAFITFACAEGISLLKHYSQILTYRPGNIKY